MSIRVGCFRKFSRSQLQSTIKGACILVEICRRAVYLNKYISFPKNSEFSGMKAYRTGQVKLDDLENIWYSHIIIVIAIIQELSSYIILHT
jgi:hypothetical protein